MENSSREAEEYDGINSTHAPEPGGGTGGTGGTGGPAGRKKLILHVDLNSTILVSDAVTDEGAVATLDYYLTTVTWGKMDRHGKWEWLSDSPSLLPPCKDAVSFHSQFGRTFDFTTGVGQRFRKFLDEHLELLRWPEGIKGDKELSLKGEDGRLYHWILPSFFQLLKDLVQEGREFAIVFRTFGIDLPRVQRAVYRAVNEGAHPLFPDLPDLKLSVNMAPGKIRCSAKGIVVKRTEDRLSSRDGERNLYQFFSSLQGLGGFQDDYDWWSVNACSIRGGKPLWIDPFDQQVQHIFIDDNIRQNDEDTVVCPKVFLDPDGSETRIACISELYDIALVQTDLLRAIADPKYFTQCVHICLENYEKNLQQGPG